MAEVHIERVAPTDLAEVIQLFTKQVYPSHPEETHRHFAGHAEEQADTFLASVAGELADYLTIRWHSNNPQFRQHNIPLIHHLAVVPPFQRQGIASRLMDVTEQLIATRASTITSFFGLPKILDTSMTHTKEKCSS
jgi:GNAT superfamily N-acetyltransferase